ncbi:MAG: F0F1 ATP synthase subunit beta, partial [Bacteroidales bacterium]
MADNKGEIIQVIGPVVDVSFEKSGGELPDIYEALEIFRKDGSRLVLETQQHLGEYTVRAIALDATDGIRRGTEVKATGASLRMPVGDQARGR